MACLAGGLRSSVSDSAELFTGLRYSCSVSIHLEEDMGMSNQIRAASAIASGGALSERGLAAMPGGTSMGALERAQSCGTREMYHPKTSVSQ